MHLIGALPFTSPDANLQFINGEETRKHMIILFFFVMEWTINRFVSFYITDAFCECDGFSSTFCNLTAQFECEKTNHVIRLCICKVYFLETFFVHI